MSRDRLALGFIPLVDAAPLIVAQEMGFAGEEGLDLDLIRAPSWSSLRDMLAFGHVSAAHMLAPVPVASALGLGGMAVSLMALSVLSMNGTVVGVSRALGDQLRAAGHDFGFDDARAAGLALIAATDGPLRLGVPFPFSMHAELMYYWLSALGQPAPQGLHIKTVPPPLMGRAIADGEIDAFCVGEPWGSQAVETGAGDLLLPGRAIWTQAPEKVLATRTDWALDHPDLAARLLRAVWRAGRWLGTQGASTTASEMLARPEHLNLPVELIDRALTGRLTISAQGDSREVPGFVTFWEGAATFPWRSQAAWIGAQMAARLGLDRDEAARKAAAVFRTDIYRDTLRDAGAILPAASFRVEGGIERETAAASQQGQLILPPNRFFDGQIFEPLLSA